MNDQISPRGKEGKEEKEGGREAEREERGKRRFLLMTKVNIII